MEAVGIEVFMREVVHKELCKQYSLNVGNVPFGKKGKLWEKIIAQLFKKYMGELGCDPKDFQAFRAKVNALHRLINNPPQRVSSDFLL